MTFIAAAVRPVRSRTGAAIERMPSDSSSSDSAQPRSRISASDSSSSDRDSTTRGITPDADGSASTSSSSAGSRSASSTRPIDVAAAGNRVPMCTEMAMIFGTGTRAVYTMSLPSSCDIELDSPVCSTSATRCGRAMSHRPWAATYAVPSSNVLVVSEYAPPAERVYPSCSSVISRRRAVGRANPVRAATSLTVSSMAVGPNALITSRPRASASTKSVLSLRLFGALRLAFMYPFRWSPRACRRSLTLAHRIAFPGHAGRCWPLLGWRLVARIG